MVQPEGYSAWRCLTAAATATATATSAATTPTPALVIQPQSPLCTETFLTFGGILEPVDVFNIAGDTTIFWTKKYS